MKQSGLLKRQKSVMDVTQTATRDTYKQFMVDTLVSTLNDSDVMGHDVFGAKRMNNVIEAWMARFDYFLLALGKSDEAGLLSGEAGPFVAEDVRQGWRPAVP